MAPVFAHTKNARATVRPKRRANDAFKRALGARPKRARIAHFRACGSFRTQALSRRASFTFENFRGARSRMGAWPSSALSPHPARHSARHYAPPPSAAPASDMPPAGSQDSARTVDPAEQRRTASAAEDFVPASDDELPSLPDISDVGMAVDGDVEIAAGGGGKPKAKDAPAAERAAASPKSGDGAEGKTVGSAPVTPAKAVTKRKPTPKKSLLKAKKPEPVKAAKGKGKAVVERAAEDDGEEDAEPSEENDDGSDGDDELLLKKPAAAVSKRKTPPLKKKPSKLVKKTPPTKKLAAEKGEKKVPVTKRVLVDIESSDEESDVEAGATSPALKESTNRVDLDSAGKRRSAPKKLIKRSSLKKPAKQAAKKPGKKPGEKKRKSSGDLENEGSPSKKTKSGAMKQRLQITKIAPSKKSVPASKTGSKENEVAAKSGKAQKPTKSTKAKKISVQKSAKINAAVASDCSDDEMEDDFVDDEEEDTIVSDADDDISEENVASSSAKNKSIGGVGIACSSSDEVSVGLIEAACTQLNGYVACDADKADIFVRSPDSKRTGSLLLAIARGIPVVDAEWLSSSIESGKFEKDLSAYESHVGAKAARLSRESTNSAGFLKRARVKIVGEPMSDAALLRQIVRHCGGKIVQDREHFAVVGSGCDGVSGVENPVSLKYLADSIEQQKLLAEAEYRPSAVST